MIHQSFTHPNLCLKILRKFSFNTGYCTRKHHFIPTHDDSNRSWLWFTKSHANDWLVTGYILIDEEKENLLNSVRFSFHQCSFMPQLAKIFAWEFPSSLICQKFFPSTVLHYTVCKAAEVITVCMGGVGLCLYVEEYVSPTVPDSAWTLSTLMQPVIYQL